MTDHDATVAALLDRAGTTYAAEAGITLKDTPAPLYRVLVLGTLQATRVQASLAVAAVRELVDAGMGTPEKMRDASWQERVDALDRAHYTRVDEQTATALGEGARQLLDDYDGDLRNLRARADGDPGRIRDLFTEFPRLGPTGASIIARELQGVWPELRPALDGKALDGAKRLGLPTDRDELAGLVDGDRLTEFAAALTRAGLDKKLAEEVTAGS
ncbi:endonuclease [Pseudonocardia sp. C8]|uniref:endonuclease n=1 Tax=Pseudonocardia sp. C8 TaxID=2762759 RepID=UPI0016433ECD|nr:endonuclease [Pseudonocardia sp. C8]MBC3194406.1 endonuclease [Pseudonocardia sp. C8]